jgi:hypothetical protein
MVLIYNNVITNIVLSMKLHISLAEEELQFYAS